MIHVNCSYPGLPRLMSLHDVPLLMTSTKAGMVDREYLDRFLTNNVRGRASAQSPFGRDRRSFPEP